MKTKILITGSNGLLGQKLVLSLVKDTTVETIATSLGENRMNVTEGYHYEALDITNKEQIEQAIQKHNPDVIINTAAMTNVDACEIQKD